MSTQMRVVRQGYRRALQLIECDTSAIQFGFRLAESVKDVEIRGVRFNTYRETEETEMTSPDPKIAEFKQRVNMEWAGDETAAAWQKHYKAMKEQLANVTQALVDAAAPQPGMRILDLASGTGEPSLSLARLVAPTGTVTATDLSEGMLAALRSNAADEGVTNIETRVCDAQEMPFSDAAFDMVTSRFGVMFFVEIDRARAEIRRVIKPSGRIAFLVWGPPAPGSYFGTTAMPFIKRLPVKPDP